MFKSLEIQNELNQLLVLNQFLDQAAKELGIKERLLMSLKLVMEEVVANIIHYAYPWDKDKQISIHLESDQNRLVITVIDSGISFNPTVKQTPDISLSVSERPIGGLGIFLVKQIMNEVKYDRIGNKNILTMVKDIADYA